MMIEGAFCESQRPADQGDALLCATRTIESRLEMHCPYPTPKEAALGNESGEQITEAGDGVCRDFTPKKPPFETAVRIGSAAIRGQ